MNRLGMRKPGALFSDRLLEPFVDLRSYVARFVQIPVATVSYELRGARQLPLPEFCTNHLLAVHPGTNRFFACSTIVSHRTGDPRQNRRG